MKNAEDKKAMTKAKLITAVSEVTGLSKADTVRALDGMLYSIKRELQQGNTIRIMRLGTFKTFQLKARDGYNPRTGEAMKIPEKVIVRFRAGAKLKEEVA